MAVTNLLNTYEYIHKFVYKISNLYVNVHNANKCRLVLDIFTQFQIAPSVIDVQLCDWLYEQQVVCNVTIQFIPMVKTAATFLRCF